jgi:hypothetical protein
MKRNRSKPTEDVHTPDVKRGHGPILELRHVYPLRRPHIEDRQHRLDHANVGEFACQVPRC